MSNTIKTIFIVIATFAFAVVSQGCAVATDATDAPTIDHPPAHVSCALDTSQSPIGLCPSNLYTVMVCTAPLATPPIGFDPAVACTATIDSLTWCCPRIPTSCAASGC